MSNFLSLQAQLDKIEVYQQSPLILILNIDTIEINPSFTNLKWLQHDELETLNTRTKRSAKKHYIISRFILKQLICRYYQLPMEEIGLLFDENVQRLVPDYCKLPLNTAISISHSNDYLTISLCFDTDIVDLKLGTDIELINKARDINKLARHFFSTNEKKTINDSQNPELSFYKLWTLKEAISKSLPVNLFSILKEDASDLLKENGLSLHHQQLENYILAVVWSKKLIQRSLNIQYLKLE